MRALFVDTGAFLAKEIASDQYHLVSRQGWNEAELRGYRLVSSEHVFDESATLIARRTNYAFASEWGRDTLDSGIEWLRAEEEDLRKALGFMRKYADQGVSFTDCLSAVLMKRTGLKRVFGFDRHFEAMGFGLWSGEPE
jgi:hypothetical protein